MSGNALLLLLCPIPHAGVSQTQLGEVKQKLLLCSLTAQALLLISAGAQPAESGSQPQAARRTMGGLEVQPTSHKSPGPGYLG